MKDTIPAARRQRSAWRGSAWRDVLCAIWRTGVLCYAMASVTSTATALDLTPWMGRPATERIHFQGDQFHRAGDPQCTSPLAGPSESPHAVGYYVGGGARVRGWVGEERRPEEGTWGTDYSGFLIHKKIDLRWSHGRRYQGGVGAYRTDGPRLIHSP